MRTVGIKALKNKLSEYVRLAADGETILISDRDRIVAELRPPEDTRAQTVNDAMLASLARDGLLTPALTRSGEPPPALRRMPLADVIAGLDEDRSDR